MVHNIKIFFQYDERFNVTTGKASAEFKDIHVYIPNITQYTKADIRSGYIIPQKSPVYRKSEKIEFFRKQKWFHAVDPNVQRAAKLDYMISQALLEMEHTSLSIYKTLRYRSWS